MVELRGNYPHNSSNLAMLTIDAGVPHITIVATSRSGLSTNFIARPATWNSGSRKYGRLTIQALRRKRGRTYG